MLATARAPGTCGELIQGKLGGTSFLVTCPINLYSVISVSLDDSGRLRGAEGLPKVQEAVHKTLDLLGCRGHGALVRIRSSLPAGKGMASSTADISAASAATAAACGHFLTPWEIARIALQIEPTDGLMFPGLTLIDYLSGRMARTLGRAPNLETVIVDLGGDVDTIGFNARRQSETIDPRKEQRLAAALQNLERALNFNDMKLFGEACTESAQANQDLLFKPELDKVLSIALESGAVGINAAHSGTVLGILLEKEKNLVPQTLLNFKKAGFKKLKRADIINGGIEILLERAGELMWIKLDESMGEISGPPQKSTG